MGIPPDPFGVPSIVVKTTKSRIHIRLFRRTFLANFTILHKQKQPHERKPKRTPFFNSVYLRSPLDAVAVRIGMGDEKECAHSSKYGRGKLFARHTFAADTLPVLSFAEVYVCTRVWAFATAAGANLLRFSSTSTWRPCGGARCKSISIFCVRLSKTGRLCGSRLQVSDGLRRCLAKVRRFWGRS